MPKGTSIRDYDWWLLAITFAICGVGVLEIWSATHASHLAGMHTHQMEWIGMGLILKTTAAPYLGTRTFRVKAAGNRRHLGVQNHIGKL